MAVNEDAAATDVIAMNNLATLINVAQEPDMTA
jgi:hypothetical protein